MLMQNPAPVKMLANVPECRENDTRVRILDSKHNSVKRWWTLIRRTAGLRLIRGITVCAAVAVSMVAQTPNIATLQRSAEAGDAKAQWDLAQAYWEGSGVPKDPAKGLEWLRKSAAQGYAGAEVTLGFLYQNGVQVPKDLHEAARWYRKAARQSDKDPKHAQTAQADLGSLAAQGVIPVNEADWRAPEPGSDTDQQVVKNSSAKKSDLKSNETQKNPSKSKAPPFSLAEIETGLNGGITSKRMTALVGQYGVDFSLSTNAKQHLTNEGADDSLLQTIASSKR
jgi:TPR repeat protein